MNRGARAASRPPTTHIGPPATGLAQGCDVFAGTVRAKWSYLYLILDLYIRRQAKLLRRSVMARP
jgi:hypothetical protein